MLTLARHRRRVGQPRAHRADRRATRRGQPRRSPSCDLRPGRAPRRRHHHVGSCHRPCGRPHQSGASRATRAGGVRQGGRVGARTRVCWSTTPPPSRRSSIISFRSAVHGIGPHLGPVAAGMKHDDRREGWQRRLASSRTRTPEPEAMCEEGDWSPGSGAISHERPSRSPSRISTPWWPPTTGWRSGRCTPCEARGLRIPEDVAVTGLRRHRRGRLARTNRSPRWRQPLAEMGRQAVRRLWSEFDGDAVPARRHHPERRTDDPPEHDRRSPTSVTGPEVA